MRRIVEQNTGCTVGLAPCRKKGHSTERLPQKQATARFSISMEKKSSGENERARAVAADMLNESHEADRELPEDAPPAGGASNRPQLRTRSYARLVRNHEPEHHADKLNQL
jgi:hypothetical protein